MASYGPIELVVLSFSGNRFTGEILSELQDLTDSDTIRIIDVLFVTKDADGVVTVVEVDAFGDAVVAVISPVEQIERAFLSHSDGEYFGALLEPNSSAAIMLFENSWAARFVTAVRRANGEVIINERIPRVVIEELLAESAD